MSINNENTIGASLVIGGGIAGVQASLDLAEAGFRVYLIEKSEAIGGVMSALDKTFPTNDCSMCILSPKLVECGRHPNVEIITMAEVEDLIGGAGNFTVRVKQRPRYIDMQKCIACGTCAEKCPKKIDDPYNEGLSKRKAAYVKYPQAVPLKYVIDSANCIYLQKGKCRACEKFCPAGAVNFADKEKTFELRVGSVVLAPGFKAFDPSGLVNYQYGINPNVITSMQFERILSPSGPTGGHLARLSDGKEPRRIAWLQCVGSRDINRCDRSYCSAVCCMYAIKEAVIAKEHSKEPLESSIFFMDMRTSGKDFERYYMRAEEEHGIRFVRSRIHSIESDPATKDPVIRYLTEEGDLRSESFDLIVLSVGLEISKDIRELAVRLGIGLDEDGFAATSCFSPVSSSRPGVYVCGAFQGPKDIPQSVMEASAAAAETAALLSRARGTMAARPPERAERDISAEELRIGVFVCHCGINIGSVVDVPAVKEYAKTLPGVAFVEENLFTCSQDTQEKMKHVIREKNLNRIVVASCSPRTHEPLFQQTIQEAGLNKFLFELANIRDQDSWVHRDEPEEATRKAKDLVRMAVAKVSLQQPLSETRLDITRRGFVIGGGIAGLEAAKALADQGYPVTVIEKGKRLGGNASRLIRTWTGEAIASYLEELVHSIEARDDIEVILGAELKAVDGFVGNFIAHVSADGRTERIPHGVAIIATGAEPLVPYEYCYGRSDRIMLSLDLDKALREGDSMASKAGCAVFIQCVGSREPSRPYCSRVCCTHSIENALLLKEINPSMDVFILYRDIRTYGGREHLYKKAREKGVIFIRYDLSHKPQVELKAGKPMVTVRDPVLAKDISISADILTLASAIVPSGSEEIAKMYKVPLNHEGFFLEAHMKLRPVDFATDGVFVAGLAHWPKPVEEAIAQAKAAASRAVSLVLSRPFILAGGVAAFINKEMCSGCRSCEQCCPFGAISYLQQEARCDVNQALCKGCGTCAATCPSEAITLMGFSHEQLYRQIDEAMAL
jgi:heterodisulfide reductase subunit A